MPHMNGGDATTISDLATWNTIRGLAGISTSRLLKSHTWPCIQQQAGHSNIIKKSKKTWSNNNIQYQFRDQARAWHVISVLEYIHIRSLCGAEQFVAAIQRRSMWIPRNEHHPGDDIYETRWLHEGLQAKKPARPHGRDIDTKMKYHRELRVANEIILQLQLPTSLKSSWLVLSLMPIFWVDKSREQ